MPSSVADGVAGLWTLILHRTVLALFPALDPIAGQFNKTFLDNGVVAVIAN